MAETKFKRWLERMAQSNRKEFGYERLECCNVNKPVKNKNRLTKKK